jgi:hypothetical protein
VEDLERNQPIVLDIPGEEDSRHTAATELALEGVGAAECYLQLIPQCR